MANWQGLDTAFTLPDFIPTDSPWRTLYVQLQHQVQTELQHLDLSTPELLLVERYITGYVINRFREALPLNDDSGYRDAGVAKDVNAHWLGIAKGVVDLIENGRKRMSKDQVSKTAVQASIMDAISEAVPDPEDRARVVRAIVDRFDRLGV